MRRSWLGSAILIGAANLAACGGGPIPPLTASPTNDWPKAWVKQLLGKQPAGYESNARRHAFNESLRAHYGANDDLFDIAALESGHGRTGVNYNGQRIEALDPALTEDGGHLNDQGQRVIGGALARHLAALAQH